MKSIKEYLNRNKFENKINNIIFDLDEESYNLLDDEFIKILESNNYILSYNMIFEALRVLYTIKIQVRNLDLCILLRGQDESHKHPKGHDLLQSIACSYDMNRFCP